MRIKFQFDAIYTPTGWRRVFSSMANELHADEYLSLLTPLHHSPLLSSKRAATIISRTRFFALLFAILTPSWAIIDYLVFSTAISLPLIGIRLVAGFAFLSLVLFVRPDTTLVSAYRGLLALFLIPSIFHLVVYFMLAQHTLIGISNAVAVGYAFLPFILICGLSVFPLSILENLALSSIVILIQLLVLLFNPNNLDMMSFGVTLWLLILLAGISAIAGFSQLAFMLTLVRQAVRDPLTGCFTRRSGEELLTLQYAISKRSNMPLALAFVDLDRFKDVNDRAGHEAGDLALRQAAVSFTQILRSNDILARWGGDEFIIIMPNTNIHQAETALSRQRLIGLSKRPDDGYLTASIGISERLQDETPDPHALIELADQRMYLAKKQGGNKIVREG
ncbi:MAG: GGDEF domain-containing protein [Zoogloeaceae bacterium]|jgi:diguanylate cyclase (GGDEF)-like protein|nr:GGDEF domain-containing protein [Zoogloeaceae bacterium]